MNAQEIWFAIVATMDDELRAAFAGDEVWAIPLIEGMLKGHEASTLKTPAEMSALSDAALMVEAINAAAKAAKFQWGQEAYHIAIGAVALAVRELIKRRIEAEDFDTPELAVYSVQDDFSDYEVRNDISSRLSMYVQAAKQFMKRKESSKAARVRRSLDAAHPELKQLRAERAEVKSQIVAITKAQRGTYEFKMMGGLHILGHIGELRVRLRDIEKKIAKLEASIPPWRE